MLVLKVVWAFPEMCSLAFENVQGRSASWAQESDGKYPSEKGVVGLKENMAFQVRRPAMSPKY